MTKIKLGTNNSAMHITSVRNLTEDEKAALDYWFKEIAEYCDFMPEHISDAMADIEWNYKTYGKLSDKQIAWVQQTYLNFCT